MNSSNLTHGPAQKVGHMRVSRKPFKRHNDTQSTEGQQDESVTSGNEDGSGENEQINDNSSAEEEQMTVKEEINERELQERAARDMQAHAASRQPDIYSNAGNNVKQIHNSNPQPRGLSH